ncbi:hypothetical protein F5Y18DRAFT_424619 [Xylariaceae sp. FL1019]|nr:hypothetical protein F5Y18DRAFT_424619 [Xylariaceae sp. FL1019]
MIGKLDVERAVVEWKIWRYLDKAVLYRANAQTVLRISASQSSIVRSPGVARARQLHAFKQPLTSLIEDTRRRLDELNISNTVFTDGECDIASVVMLTPEALRTAGFDAWLTRHSNWHAIDHAEGIENPGLGGCEVVVQGAVRLRTEMPKGWKILELVPFLDLESLTDAASEVDRVVVDDPPSITAESHSR